MSEAQVNIIPIACLKGGLMEVTRAIIGRTAALQ